MTPGQWFGLILTVATVVTTHGVLVYDLWLWRRGRLTISEGVWADLEAWRDHNAPFPWRSVFMPAATTMSGIGLAIHFFS